MTQNNLYLMFVRNVPFVRMIFLRLLLVVSVFCVLSCNSGVGGSTGGNPLQSSLPLQISADVQ